MPASKSERVEESEERPRVVDAQVGIEMEGDAQKQVAECDAEDERWHGAAHEEAPVPRAAPARIGNLAAVVEADRAQEKGEQRQDQRDVKAGKRGCVDERPCRERGAAGGDEPHLVAFPVRTDRVQHDAALVVVPAHERQERADAEIHAVHDREADQQHADEQPPDELQRGVVEHVNHTDPASVAGPDSKW